MCKQMMEQRNQIESDLNKKLERVLENIRKKGVSNVPAVMVNMDKLFIANREYFEKQGFFFKTIPKIENGNIVCYAMLKLQGDGELASRYWSRIREARKVFVKNQRRIIWDMLREAQGCPITVDMKCLLFENKTFFEERGYYFEIESRSGEDQSVYLVRMKKRC